jgi:hypothetical protein
MSLTAEHFAAAARRLGCDVAAVRAVAEVESVGSGFLPTGEPTVLFERHIFAALTDNRYDGARAPGLPAKYSLVSDCSASGKGEYGPQSAQHARLHAAALLDRDAALKSASWGMFQILGRYHGEAGHATIQAFVNAMYSGDREHLESFVSLVLARGLGDELRDHRWAELALRYNGKGYKVNRYDEKLAAAYEKWSK